MITAGPGRRIAVIGDVGGHLAELRAELGRLGVPDRGAGPLPEDLIVVQVGDLIHRGPASDTAVAFVDEHLRRQPDRWVQLVGNHEAQYLRPPAFEWPERITHHSADLLRRWWSEGLMRVGVALRSGGEEFLVTHAGLTRGYWSEILGAPGDVDAAATALDALGEAGDDALYRAGAMLGSGGPDPLAGPLWAEPGRELLAGWLECAMPFSQVHGHAAWSALARPGSPGDLDTLISERTAVDADRGHESTVLAGGRILGVDPGHGRRPRARWRALVLTGRDEKG